MGKLKAIWQWLDRKKTIIGTISLMASKVFPEHTVTHQVLSTVGEVFGAVGIFHKVVKKDYGKLPSGKSLDKMRKLIKESLKEK